MTLPPVYKAERGDLLEHILQAQKVHGDLFYLQVAKSGYFVACHPDIAYDILVKQKAIFVKGSEKQTKGLPAVLGQGLLTVTDSESWLAQRRVLQPLFHKEQLSVWTQHIFTVTEQLLSDWRTSGITQLDVSTELLKLGRTLMYRLLFSMADEQMARYPLTVPLSLVLANAKRVRLLNAQNDAVIYRLIAERRAALAAGHRFDDVLTLLLESRDADTGAAMTDTQLRDELLTLLAAGHETTAYALSWTVWLLFNAPAALDKLRAELGLFTNTPFGAERLKQLPYLEAVFKEGLRLYPTIPATPRTALVDTQLAGFRIPAGSRIFVSIYALHRHQDLWPEPEVFKPERFLDGALRPEAYMPFGLGERFCLGRNLALLQGQLVLALLVQKLELGVTSEVPRNRLAVSLSPREPLLATLTWR